MKTHPLRQKMINMMYLVLIAMSLLDPIFEYIDAFTDLNRTLENANLKLDQRNLRTVATIQTFKNLDSLQYGDIYNKVMSAQQVADTTVNFLENVKVDLIRESGGMGPYRHLKGSDNATLPTNKVYRSGLGKNIKKKLTYTKEALMSILGNSADAHMLDTVLILSETLPKSTGKYYSWDRYYFDNVPLNAVVALLSKFQNDVRVAESMVINYYNDEIQNGNNGKGNYNFEFIANDTSKLDTIYLAKGVKKHDVFQVGEDGVTTITLPVNKRDESSNAVIYVYDDKGQVKDSFLFNNGVGEIKLPTDQIGEFKIKGVVKFRYPDKDQNNKNQSEALLAQGQTTGKGQQGQTAGKGQQGQTSSNNGQQGSTAANNGQQGQTAANNGQMGLTSTTNGQQGQTSTSKGQQGQTSTKAGQVSNKAAQLGQQGNVEGEGQNGQETAMTERNKETRTLKQQKRKEDSYPFQVDYKVTDSKPFISQKDYKTLYLGINNPLNVFHPEFATKDYKVSISQGKIINNGSDFYAEPSREGFASVTLSVPDGHGGYKKVAEDIFKVKELPKPLVDLYDKEGGSIPAKIFKMQKGLTANMKDLPVDVNYRVTDFSVTYVNANGLGIFKENVKGSYFTGKSRELIDLAQPGDIFIFDNIHVKGPDGLNKSVDAIIFNIL